MEKRLGRAWKAIEAEGGARCPVCCGWMRAPDEGGGVRCTDCGSVLS